MGNIDRYPTYKGGKVTEVVVYANYIGLRRFNWYVVNIGRWSPYEGGQLNRFHCINKTKIWFFALRTFLHCLFALFDDVCCISSSVNSNHLWACRLVNKKWINQKLLQSLRSQASPCGIYGGQSGTLTGSYPSTSVFPSHSHSIIAPYSSFTDAVWY